jgi:tetratricopeptide (TPR) repeat protein
MRGSTLTQLGSLALAIAAGCGIHNVERDTAKSATRLDLAKDFLRKHQLEAAETETNRALAFNPANDEAYLVRGLVHVIRAIDTQRTLEIEACLTGVDAEATQRDLDIALRKADEDFERATKLTPDYGESWANRGVVHNLLENYDAAATYSEGAGEPDPADSPGLTRGSSGGLYHQNKLVEAAKSCVKQSSFNSTCALQLIGLRGLLARESGKSCGTFSRRHLMIRPADHRKPALFDGRGCSGPC